MNHRIITFIDSRHALEGSSGSVDRMFLGHQAIGLDDEQSLVVQMHMHLTGTLASLDCDTLLLRQSRKPPSPSLSLDLVVGQIWWVLMADDMGREGERVRGRREFGGSRVVGR
jgi:hypothetical protein